MYCIQNDINFKNDIIKQVQPNIQLNSVWQYIRRYLLEIELKNLPKVTKILKENNIFYENIAIVQKDYFEILNELKININDLYKVNNKWYNNY